MDDFCRNLIGRLDIDRPTAERVYLFLVQNAELVPAWLGLRVGKPSAREHAEAPPGRGRA
jgi:hypothetical protein